ncbi:MAG: PhoX family phosphatase [Hyphomonadaceae bacterium]|nr:PhoX family phosphatase [Hyphomonadaceae bacterium]
MHIQDLIAERLSRRGLLGGLAGLPLLSLAPACTTTPATSDASGALTFSPVAATTADAVTVPAGYSARAVIAWGDALFSDLPGFDPDALTRSDQEKRFGMNNDMLALFPAEHAFPPPRDGTRMILCANNEYAGLEMMFPAVARREDFTAAHAAAAIASTGVSIVALEKTEAGWSAVQDAHVNRRITPFTPALFSGPAAEHPWIRAAGAINNAQEGVAGPAIACGTHANCAGGQTPWGTYLTSEENFHYLFHASEPAAAPLAGAQRDGAYRRDCTRMMVPPQYPSYGALAPPQYDMAKNPHGPSLYGWVVEIDPYDPSSAPRKRTHLGRKTGECATTALTRDGRVAVYMGDDQNNEHVYKFVSAGRFDPADRAAAFSLLDTGVLHAARFEADGTGRWIPLTRAAANAALGAGPPGGDIPGFDTEADVFMRVRDAALALGATQMDRPEDVEALRDDNWVGRGSVFIVCTNNYVRATARPANPDRTAGQPNRTGHIIRIEEANHDCGAATFTWDVFALAGDPDASSVETRAGAVLVSTAVDGASTFTGDRFACPDNICFDRALNVWIATDGNDTVFNDCNDSVLVAPTDPAAARNVKRFLVGPMGAEICGPTMAPDEKAFFVAIQHPGEDNAGVRYSSARFRDNVRPGSSFPDGGGAWPRSAVVVITRDDGGQIGT